MKMKHVCLMIVLFFYSCGIMNDKHTSKTFNEVTYEAKLHQEIKTEKVLKDNSLKMIVKDDSLNKTWNIQLWPRGKFTFSPQKGFEGEADKLMINGQLAQRSSSNETEARDKAEKKSVDVTLHEKKKNVGTTKQEEKSIAPNSGWVVTVGFLLGILVLLFYLQKLFISK